MASTTHNIRVVTLLNAEEYIALQAMSDESGLSDSAFIRSLLKSAARRHAMEKVSADSSALDSAQAAQVVSSHKE